jgi:hypothetical protein
MNLHFGCQVMVLDQDGGETEVEQLMEMFMAINAEDDDNNDWIIHREFFTSLSATVKIDTSEGSKKQHIPFQD